MQPLYLYVCIAFLFPLLCLDQTQPDILSITSPGAFHIIWLDGEGWREWGCWGTLLGALELLAGALWSSPHGPNARPYLPFHNDPIHIGLALAPWFPAGTHWKLFIISDTEGKIPLVLLKIHSLSFHLAAAMRSLPSAGNCSVRTAAMRQRS